MSKPKSVNILFCQGVEGKSVYINDTRVSGSKPWGGGKTLAEFNPSLADVRAALRDKSPTKAQFWRRVAKLAGELAFSDGARAIPYKVMSNDNAVGAIRSLIEDVRSLDSIDSLNKKHHERIIAKLEAALKAWEVA